MSDEHRARCACGKNEGRGWHHMWVGCYSRSSEPWRVDTREKGVVFGHPGSRKAQANTLDGEGGQWRNKYGLLQLKTDVYH